MGTGVQGWLKPAAAGVQEPDFSPIRASAAPSRSSGVEENGDDRAFRRWMSSRTDRPSASASAATKSSLAGILTRMGRMGAEPPWLVDIPPTPRRQPDGPALALSPTAGLARAARKPGQDQEETG